MAEQARRRRENFKVGVYAVLGTTTFMLVGLLIQGCRDHPTPAETATAVEAETGPIPSNAPPAADPGSPALPAPPAVAAVAAVTNPPLPPVAAAVPAPQKPAPGRAVSPKAAETVYVVKSGDTLERIARAHHTTAAAVRSANGLKTDRLAVGRKLKLPAAKTAWLWSWAVRG
jgi:LysM repeat protein